MIQNEISSVAIFIDRSGSLVPERRTFIFQNGFRVIAAGVLANLMSAAIAGVILSL